MEDTEKRMQEFDDNYDDKNIENPYNAAEQNSKMQEFVERFESLVEEYGIETYVAVFKPEGLQENQQICLHRPKDLITITKMLKQTHREFFMQVMAQCGESV